MKTVNGKVEELLGIAKAYGVGAVEGMSGSGNVSLDVHATGPIKNTDAMNFSGTWRAAECVAEDAVAHSAFERSQREHAVHAEFREPDQSGGLSGLDQCQRKSQHRQLPGAQADFRVDGRQDQCRRTGEDHRGPRKKLRPQKKADASWSLVPTANATPAPAAQPSLLQKRNRYRHHRGGQHPLSADGAHQCALRT